jgi:uncharacterized protein
MDMDFQWDPEKAAGNLRKHGISFEEVKQVFSDPLFLTFADLDHSFEERRFVMIGELRDGRLVVVSYTDRDQITRIISARPATRQERKTYESEC